MAWAAGDVIENRPALSRWHPDHAAVTVTQVLDYLSRNVENSQAIVRSAVRVGCEQRIEAVPYRRAECASLSRHFHSRGNHQFGRSDRQFHVAWLIWPVVSRRGLWNRIERSRR